MVVYGIFIKSPNSNWQYKSDMLRLQYGIPKPF